MNNLDTKSSLSEGQLLYDGTSQAPFGRLICFLRPASGEILRALVCSNHFDVEDRTLLFTNDGADVAGEVSYLAKETNETPTFFSILQVDSCKSVLAGSLGSRYDWSGDNHLSLLGETVKSPTTSVIMEIVGANVAALLPVGDSSEVRRLDGLIEIARKDRKENLPQLLFGSLIQSSDETVIGVVVGDTRSRIFLAPVSRPLLDLGIELAKEDDARAHNDVAAATAMEETTTRTVGRMPNNIEALVYLSNEPLAKFQRRLKSVAVVYATGANSSQPKKFV